MGLLWYEIFKKMFEFHVLSCVVSDTEKLFIAKTLQYRLLGQTAYVAIISTFYFGSNSHRMKHSRKYVGLWHKISDLLHALL